MKKNRIFYFDFLRIMAIFAVVSLHIANHHWADTDVNTFEWQIYNLYLSLVRWGVPVFVMISGALFLGKDVSIKKLYRKYILRIVVSLYFWSVLYALWNDFVVEKSFSKSGFIKEVLFGHYHLWFMFMLIGLYMIVPLLNKIVANKKTAWYFVILSFVFVFAIPQLTEIAGFKFSGVSNIVNALVSRLQLHMILGYSGYFVLGYLLNETVIKKKHRRLIYLSGLLGIVLTIVLTSVFSVAMQSPKTTFFANPTINILMVSVAVFVFAKTHLNKPLLSERKQNFLLFFSKCSFGIYLIHPFFIETLDHLLHITPRSFNPVLSVPALTLLVFISAFLVSAILNKIPFVKKWLV